MTNLTIAFINYTNYTYPPPQWIYTYFIMLYTIVATSKDSSITEVNNLLLFMQFIKKIMNNTQKVQQSPWVTGALVL